jgi:hypothetical protein
MKYVQQSAIEDLILNRLSFYKTDFKFPHVLMQTLSSDAFQTDDVANSS